MTRNSIDHNLYFCMSGGLCMIMVLYVDDFLLTEDDMTKIQFKKKT